MQVGMHQYYIPDHVSNFFMNYFNNFLLRFSSKIFTRTSFKKGIATGIHHLYHTVRHGLNIIIKAAKRESKGIKANTEICIQQGFIDNMTVTTETNIQVR